MNLRLDPLEARDMPAPLVAILDTGADYTHPALRAHIWTNPREIPGNGKDDDRNGYIDDVRGFDFANMDANPQDDNGHGTHVAGIAEKGGADVMIVKVLDAAAMGYESRVAAGIRYAVNNGARVLSLSLGGYSPMPLIASAVRWAQSKGAVIVAAAGNDGLDLRRFPLYPASLPGVISVGASDWSQSNYGATVTAPGRSIYSTLPGGKYGRYSGTSMAAPVIAARLAVLWVAHPDWKAAKVAASLSYRGI